MTCGRGVLGLLFSFEILTSLNPYLKHEINKYWANTSLKTLAIISLFITVVDRTITLDKMYLFFSILYFCCAVSGQPFTGRGIIMKTRNVWDTVYQKRHWITKGEVQNGHTYHQSRPTKHMVFGELNLGTYLHAGRWCLHFHRISSSVLGLPSVLL